MYNVHHSATLTYQHCLSPNPPKRSETSCESAPRKESRAFATQDEFKIPFQFPDLSKTAYLYFCCKDTNTLRIRCSLLLILSVQGVREVCSQKICLQFLFGGHAFLHHLYVLLSFHYVLYHRLAKKTPVLPRILELL